MEMDRAAYSRCGQIGKAAEICEARDYQCDFLPDAERLWMADAAEGSTALADLLLLLCALAEGRRVDAHS